MRIRLDRTLCDGFGICAKHAPDDFSIDDWGYASYATPGGAVPEERREAVHRAILDCPVHAVTELSSPTDE